MRPWHIQKQFEPERQAKAEQKHGWCLRRMASAGRVDVGGFEEEGLQVDDARQGVAHNGCQRCAAPFGRQEINVGVQDDRAGSAMVLKGRRPMQMRMVPAAKSSAYC